MVNLSSGKAIAKIEDGELVSYRLKGHEFIHQKGSPGWRNSDTEMFPVIGPTAEAALVVGVGGLELERVPGAGVLLVAAALLVGQLAEQPGGDLEVDVA